MIEITKQTIVASDGNFEEHPESYRPRVFMETCTNLSECYLVQNPPVEPIMAVFELLADGKAIQWPSFPDKATCGFDYWKLYAPLMNCITMVRHDIPADWKFTRPEPDVIPYIKPIFGQNGYTQIGQIVEYFPRETVEAISQADGDSSPLAHLPEGSH
jgi:hypothetical protein